MATPLENNYLSNFDLEYLLGPASAVDSIGENAGLSNYVNQENNVHELSLPLHVDNEESKLKSDYESLKIHCAKLENDHDSLKNDYKELKKDYAKLALDYASLQKENMDHAMASIDNGKKFENMELQANQYLITINILQNKCELHEINIASQESNIKQFQCLVQEMSTGNDDLKKQLKAEKVIAREGRKIISNLKSTIESHTEHLCLMGCVIQGKLKPDKDIRRLIKKYCKKDTSPKETEESFECKSIDTGRGSSLAFSDGDRSFYSPTYSYNFSPLSTCSTILRNGQAKQMKDACSSPLPLTKSLDKSTSPIIFDAIDRPLKNTLDMSTSPIIFEHSKSPETRLNDSLMPVSPISLNETRMRMLPVSTAELTLNPECVEAVKIQPEVIEIPWNSQNTSKKDSHSICKEYKSPQHISKSLSHKAKDSLLEEADKTPRHNIETVKKTTTGSLFAEKLKHTKTSSVNLISNSLVEETDKTPKCMAKKPDESKNSKLADGFKTPRHTTDISEDATYSIFGEDPETPQYIAQKPDNATNSTSVIELKNPRQTTNSPKKIIHSIFDEDSDYLKHKTKKTDEPTNSIPVEGAKSPLHSSNTANTGTISDIVPKTPLYRESNVSSKPINEEKSLNKQTSKTFDTTINSVYLENSVELMKQTYGKVTDSLKTPDIPHKLIFDNEFKTQNSTEIPQVTSVFDEESEISQAMKMPDIPRKSMLDNKVKTQHSTEIPQVTLVFDEESEISQAMKMPDIPRKSMLDNKVKTQYSTEIPQITLSVFDEESEISQAMKTSDIPRKSMLDNKVKTQHSTEIPKITVSVFDEESELSEAMKTPDLVSTLYSKKSNETERNNTEISKITPSFIEIAKSLACTSETPAIYTSPISENSPSRSSSAASYYSTDYEDRTSPLTLSECPNNATALTLAEDKMTSTADMTSKISEKLNEIYSQADDNLQDDNENNLEIQMILDKHRLNLKMISPMSITPEPDQENESSKLENEVSADNIQAPKTVSRIPEITSQTLHRFDKKPNDYKIDKESRCNSRYESQSDHASIVNSRNQQQMREFKNINKNANVDTPHKLSVSEPSHQISAKNPGMKNNKKLSGLQKQYQINVPKQQVNTKSLQKHLRWTPYPIPVVSQCPENLSLNKEKDMKIMAELKEKQLSKEKVTKGNESMVSCNQNMPLIPTQADPGSVPNIEFDIGIQTKPKLQFGLKSTQLAVSSQENDKHDLNVSQNTSSCLKNTERLKISNMECKPQTLATTLFETSPRRSSQLSIESQSTSKREIRHTPIIAPVQTLPKNSEHLPELNKMPLIPTQAGPGSVPNTEFGIRIQTKPKLQSGLKIGQLAVTSQANDKQELNVSQNTSPCLKNTERLKMSNMECKPQTLATTLFETSPRKSSQLSIESQSTSKREIRRTPIIAAVRTPRKNSEHLPELNKMPLIPTQADPGSVPNTEFGIRIRTKPKLQSGQKIGQLAVTSQANDKHELNVSQNTSPCLKNTERLKMSNMECKPQTLATTLFETSPRRSSQLSIESQSTSKREIRHTPITQSTSKREIRHTPIIAAVQTPPKNSEHLPDLNKMPLIPTQAGPGSVPNTEFGIRIQTKPKLQSGLKIEQLAVTSQANDKHELNVSQSTSPCLKNTERLKMSNMECKPQTLATTLFETSPRKSSQLSIESQSTSKREIRHTPIIAAVQTLPKNSEHLSDLNKMPLIPTQAGPGSVPNTEFGIRIQTKPKLQSGLKIEQLAVTSQANDKHELNVSQSTSPCLKNTETHKMSNMECKPQTLATTLFETSPRRSSQLSIESQSTSKREISHTPITQSTSKREIRHTPIIAAVQTPPKNSEHLPDLNKMPLIPTQADPGSVPNTEFGIRIQTKPKLQSGQKIGQLAVTSQANDKHELNVSQNTSPCPKNNEILKMSNMECKPQTLATTLFETSPRRSSQLSIESQSTSKREIRHTPITQSTSKREIRRTPRIAPVQTLPKNSEHLPELNKKCPPPPIQIKSLPEIGTRSSHQYSEIQIHNDKVSQPKSKELGKEVETNIHSFSATHIVLPQTDNNTTNEIKGKTNPDEIDYIASPPSKKIRISHMALQNSRDSGTKRRLCMSPQQDDKRKKPNLQVIDTDCNNKSKSSATSNIPETELNSDINNHTPILLNKSVPEQARHCADYNDINLFLSESDDVSPKELKNPSKNFIEVKDLLSTMLEKYASVTHGPYKKAKEDPTVKNLAIIIESGVSKCAKCRENPEEYKKAIDEFVSSLKSQDTKNFVNGLLKYLNNPARKAELPKFIKPKAPPIITPSEKTLIDVILEIQGPNCNIVEEILDNIELTLFLLDRGATPVFEIVESMAHFFAAICSYYRNVSRLRMFMLNALYCISFKAMPLIKQCLDVYPTALPNGDTVSAKSPLIRCFVFMLHFYACDDPFKRVQELRERLKFKYNYNLVEENESTILFMFKSAIDQLTENKIEKDMLRISLIVLAKRRGTTWCHKNIIQKILLPMIRGQIPVSDTGKRFCIVTLGPLLKPYNKEMMVHREEVINLLMNMLMETQRHELKEDILTSLITLDTPTTWEPVNKYLIQWTPPAISPAFEEVLKRYIRKRHVSKFKGFYLKYYSEI